MKNFLIKIIFAISVSTTSFLLAEVKEVRAECQIVDARFRVVGANGQPTPVSVSGWYRDDARPYVYVDVQTLGCNGETIEFSLTESDNLNIINFLLDDDVNGSQSNDNGLQLISGGEDPLSCLTSNPTCIDNRPIPIAAAASENNFTVVLQAGEDECDQESDIDCNYYIRINDDSVPSTASTFSQVSQLKYNCHGLACNEDWTWVDVINYLQNHPGDPALISNQTPVTTTSVGITNVPVDIENPIGGSDMTIIDFIDKIIRFGITVGIPLVAIAIIYSGLLFVTARGAESQLSTAKTAFTYAVIGGALILGSWIFAKIIRDAIDSLAMIMNYFV